MTPRPNLKPTVRNSEFYLTRMGVAPEPTLQHVHADRDRGDRLPLRNDMKISGLLM